MASSMAMTASFLPVAAKHPSTAARRALVVAKASTSGVAANDGSNTNLEIKNVKVESRRELVATAVMVAAATLAKAAMAEEPERGSPEAKKKYATICVTNPTARICRK